MAGYGIRIFSHEKQNNGFPSFIQVQTSRCTPRVTFISLILLILLILWKLLQIQTPNPIIRSHSPQVIALLPITKHEMITTLQKYKI